MTKTPQLFPNHQHRWVDHPVNPRLVRCTICGFDPPRAAAKLDGAMTPQIVPVTDSGVAT